MNLQEIENLKSILTQFVIKGYNIKCFTPHNTTSSKISGKIIGIGFKPLWASPIDYKIDQIELNYIDQKGNLKPYYLYNVIGYEIISYDGKELESSNNISFNIHLYSPTRSANNKSFEKIRIDISK
ncbi:hypothetical protein [Defluviitalea phaphyphila]|uniref:hypothetical protein n=1 Tax=Defluviitalea phaphyphila TaxID=1473580 RepID=UPI0007306873|nr:hypothetical protein [Defluviitalea phaphyphila]